MGDSSAQLRQSLPPQSMLHSSSSGRTELGEPLVSGNSNSIGARIQL
jgi:hypothetical protein